METARSAFSVMPFFTSPPDGSTYYFRPSTSMIASISVPKGHSELAPLTLDNLHAVAPEHGLIDDASPLSGMRANREYFQTRIVSKGRSLDLASAIIQK